jgi:ankyrin repeat protein
MAGIVLPDISYGHAIYNASQLGLTQLVKMLIHAGVNANGDGKGEDRHKSALCAASEYGRLEIAQDLLKAGHGDGIHNSVQLALENGHTAIVELRIKRACKVRPITCGLLQSAASHGTIELVRRLLDTKPNRGRKSAALSKACKAGRVEIARLLLSKGAKAILRMPSWNPSG